MTRPPFAPPTDADIRVVSSQLGRPARGVIGIAARKTDPELMKKVNASLAKLKANGTIDKILAKWGL